MVFRIHFTTQDLARTHLAPEPMPLTELGLAARALQDRSQPARLDAWRHRVHRGLSTGARMALSLFPPVGWQFGCRDVAGTPDEGLDLMHAMPRREIDETLAFIARWQPVPSWVRPMPGDPALFRRFVEGFADLYAVALGPHETQLADLFAADRAMRMRQLARGGVEGLLTGVSPRWMRWKSPVLEIQMVNGIDFDLFLDGRGVLLTPSMLGTRAIVTAPMNDHDQPVVLYPVGNDEPLRRLTTFAPGRGSAISALLGHTRAVVLTTIADHPGCTTTELAARARISTASASEHATVLRRARLITTARQRNTALHSPTDLGIALLDRP